MGTTDYLPDRMFARLLTFFAVLSSFAALGTPAQAMMAESAVARSAAEACETDKEDARCECRTTIRLRDWRLEFDRICRPRGPVIFLPTVQIGPDRSRE